MSSSAFDKPTTCDRNMQASTTSENSFCRYRAANIEGIKNPCKSVVWGGVGFVC